MNTIFHIDESAKWPMIFSNVQHMHQWMKENDIDGTIEDTLSNSSINLKELRDLNVDVAVCHNSMAQRHIEPKDLQANLRIVPAGVVELAQKQQAGFSYIRP